MLRRKLEKSETSRNELRQNTDLLESKVAPSRPMWGPCVGEVHWQGKCWGAWLWAECFLRSLKITSKVHAAIVPILQRRKLRPWAIRYLPEATKLVCVDSNPWPLAPKGRISYLSHKSTSQDKKNRFGYLKAVNFCLSKHKMKTHHMLRDDVCNTCNWQRVLKICKELP